jgi:hypothetical protein
MTGTDPSPAKCGVFHVQQFRPPLDRCANLATPSMDAERNPRDGREAAGAMPVASIDDEAEAWT